MFDEQLLEQLKERITLSEVVGKNVALKKRGHEFHGLCPFHKEKTPSFTLNNEKGFYHCFGCGKHGSVFDFLMFQHHISFVEAIEMAAQMAGVTLPKTQHNPEVSAEHKALYDVCAAATTYFQKTLHSPQGKDALRYLNQQRGLSFKTIEDYQLGWAPDSWDSLTNALTAQDFQISTLQKAGLVSTKDNGKTYDKFRGRVMFPISDRKGRIVAFGGRILGEGEPKYLNSPETPIFHKGHVLYNWPTAQNSSQKDWPLVVVEGYMDVISLHEKGYHRAVAPLGTALTEHHIQALWRLSAKPVLCFDGDTAGSTAAFRAAERALPLLKPGYTLSFVSLPYKKDPDSYIQEKGLTSFKEFVQDAQGLSHTLWQHALGQANPRTPEDKALLKQNLNQFCEKITDASVKAYYKEDFKERLFVWGRPQKTSARQAPIFQKMNPTLIQECILLKTLILFPRLILSVEEELSQAHFQYSETQKILNHLFSYLVDKKRLESDALHDYLKHKIHGDAFSMIMTDDLLVHAPFLKSADEKVILQSWKKIFNAYLLRQTMKADLSEARQRLNAALTQEEWQRYKDLKGVFAPETDEKDI